MLFARHAQQLNSSAGLKLFQPAHLMREAPWAFELILLFSLLLGVEFTLLGPARLASMSPHPFWLPVILMSVQYGAGGGLAAALTAIAVSCVIGWPDQAGGEDFYDYARRIWGEPMMWLGAAIILGGLRSQHLYTLDDLHDQLADAEEQRQQIGKLCNTLKSHCEHLERRMACSRDRSIEAGLAALASVRNSESKDLPHSLAAAVELLLGPATYTVLFYGDGRLSERSEFKRFGDPQREAASTTGLSPELEDALVREKRHLSILRDDDARLLAGTALFAAPIVSSGSEQVLGALLIQSMDASHIRQERETGLDAICRELAHALAREQIVVNFAHERMAVASRQVQGRSGEKHRTAATVPKVEPVGAEHILLSPRAPVAETRRGAHLQVHAASQAGGE